MVEKEFIYFLGAFFCTFDSQQTRFSFYEEFSASQCSTRKPSAGGFGEQISWIRSPMDFLKCNWDASLDGWSTKMGMGLVVRDSLGGFKAAAISTTPFITDSEMAESIVARWALSICAELGFQSVVFEGDALEVVNSLISTSQCWRICGCIVEDTRRMLHQFNSWTVKQARRSTNQVAHFLAKHALSIVQDFVWRECPSFLHDLVFAEQL